jgi:hypothetical protein
MHSLCFKFVSSAARGGCNTFRSQKKKHNSLTKHYSSIFVKNKNSTTFKSLETMPQIRNNSSEMSTLTTLVDELLSTYPLMRVKDKPRVEGILKALLVGGLDKLQMGPIL